MRIIAPEQLALIKRLLEIGDNLAFYDELGHGATAASQEWTTLRERLREIGGPESLSDHEAAE